MFIRYIYRKTIHSVSCVSTKLKSQILLLHKWMSNIKLGLIVRDISLFLQCFEYFNFKLPEILKCLLFLEVDLQQSFVFYSMLSIPALQFFRHSEVICSTFWVFRCTPQGGDKVWGLLQFTRLRVSQRASPPQLRISLKTAQRETVHISCCRFEKSLFVFILFLIGEDKSGHASAG